MASRRSREAALADLVAGLLDARREVEASAASWARAAAEDEDSGTSPHAPRGSTPAPAAPERDQDEAPADAGAEPDDTPDEPLTPPADLSEHRRRLLVAGLTRVRST